MSTEERSGFVTWEELEHHYTSEFEGRHNSRSNDTINQVHNVIRGMDGKRLRYQDLIA